MLDFDVTEYCVEVSHLPTYRVDSSGDLNFRVLRVVDALDVFQEILTSQEDRSLRHIFACEEHLSECDDAFDCPLACVLKLLFELPTNTFSCVN